MSAKQVTIGKAFEFALLCAFLEKLSKVTLVTAIQNNAYLITKGCFDSFGEEDQSKYKLSASFAVNFLLDLEPRLSYGIDEKDILQLEILPDKRGQEGDVRDVIAIRSFQKWEIGVSAKNNHRAVKHQRLSRRIDFGKKWLGLDCSHEYFSEIVPIFNHLAELRRLSKRTQTWESLGDYHSSIYVPILDSFRKELLRLDKEYPGIVAEKLVRYLIGSNDFYKIIKGNNKVEIQAYNLNGTLNMPFGNFKATYKVPKLKLPNRLIEIVYQDNSKTTLLVSLNEGWQISFRIHNASSKIESSLKFDVNLVSVPHTMFTNHLSIG